MTASELERLIRGAVSGDHGATAELLVRHSGRLARRLRTRLELNPFADFSAEDVLQEVFVDVFQGIGTFRPEDGTPFHAWLNRVVDNRLGKFLRDRSRIKRGGGAWRADAPHGSVIRLINDLNDPNAKTASERFAASEAKQAITLCVASLPDAQREAVQRFYLQQQDLAETAQAMGISRDAARGLIYRAKQSLRDMMGGSSRWFRKKQ